MANERLESGRFPDQRGDRFPDQRGDRFPEQRGAQRGDQRGDEWSYQRGAHRVDQRGARRADRRGTRRAASRGGARAGRRERGENFGENFPVAMRVLPGRIRTHLRAVYAVARAIDDLGDRAEGDRTARLWAFAADLAAIWRDETPRALVLRRLVPTVRACGLPREPFDRLIEANLWDQKVKAYASYDDLLTYCALSAQPVGRIVLTVFGVSTPEAVELSDRICTALQLLEHWQDVAEDRRAGRTYLPREDLDAFGVPDSDLDRRTTSAAVARLMAFQTDRAAALLASGAPLVTLLRGWARLAVAGYLAGGEAAVDGLRRSGGVVLAGSPGTRRRDVARHLIAHLIAHLVARLARAARTSLTRTSLTRARVAGALAAAARSVQAKAFQARAWWGRAGWGRAVRAAAGWARGVWARAVRARGTS